MTQYKQHKLGQLMPPMTDEEYDTLRDGMKTDGFDHDHPIMLFEGQILDGWHRYQATQDLGITKISLSNFTGSEEDAKRYVIRENMVRRHLTTSQRAMIAAKLVEDEIGDPPQSVTPTATQTGANLHQSGDHGGQKEPKKPANAKKKSVKQAVKKAAKDLKVSPRSVNTARSLLKADPEGAKGVEAGDQSLNAAAKKAEKADKKAAAYNKAVQIIEGVLGDGFVIQAKMKHSDVIKMSGIIPDEMKRIEPFLRCGWTFDMAMGKETANISLAHPFRIGVDRANAAGGKFSFTAKAYGKEWEIQITEAKPN